MVLNLNLLKVHQSDAKDQSYLEPLAYMVDIFYEAN